MFTKLNSKTTVSVIDRYGYELDTLTLTNTAAAELYPDMAHIRIQWTADKSACPKWEELVKPVAYAGKDWYGNFAWGSAVKRGQTIGLLEDCLTHMTQTNEDGQRVQHWLLVTSVVSSLQDGLDKRPPYTKEHPFRKKDNSLVPFCKAVLLQGPITADGAGKNPAPLLLTVNITVNMTYSANYSSPPGRTRVHPPREP